MGPPRAAGWSQMLIFKASDEFEPRACAVWLANAPPSVQIPLGPTAVWGPTFQECFPAKGQQFNRFGRVRFVEGARCKLLGPRRAREWKRPLFCALGTWFCSEVFYFHHRILESLSQRCKLQPIPSTKQPPPMQHSRHSTSALSCWTKVSSAFRALAITSSAANHLWQVSRGAPYTRLTGMPENKIDTEYR